MDWMEVKADAARWMIDLKEVAAWSVAGANPEQATLELTLKSGKTIEIEGLAADMDAVAGHLDQTFTARHRFEVRPFVFRPPAPRVGRPRSTAEDIGDR